MPEALYKSVLKGRLALKFSRYLARRRTVFPKDRAPRSFVGAANGS